MAITDKQKQIVEDALRCDEGACFFNWGEDSVTAYNAIHNIIDDFMIDVDTNGNLSYTPVSNNGVTICIKQNG